MMQVADTGAVPILLLVLPSLTCSILAIQLPGTLNYILIWGAESSVQQTQVSTTSLS